MTRKGVRTLARGCVWDPKTGVARFLVYPKGSQKKKRLTIRCGSEEEVRDKFHAFRRKWKRATPGTGPVPTLRQFYDEYFDEITAGLKPATIRGYRHALEGRLFEVFGNERLDEITAGTLKLYQKRLVKEGLANASVNCYINVVKTMIGKAVEWEIVAESPLRRPIRALKVAAPTNELSQAERSAFLSAFDDRAGFDAYLEKTMPRGNVRKLNCARAKDQFGGRRKHGAGIKPGSLAADAYFERFRSTKPFFVLLLTTGLRKTDARLIRWSEIDLENNLIRLTTRKKSVDVVLPITSEFRPLLLECRRRPVISEFVFSENGGPLNESRIARAFRIAKKMAGLTRRFRLHDCRHTVACDLVSSGVSLAMTATFLAHKDPRTTAHYARAEKYATAEVARQALEARINQNA